MDCFAKYLLLITVLSALLQQGSSTKIAYKKTLDGKTNAIKEKRIKLKPEAITTLMPPLTTTPTLSTTTTTTPAAVISTTTVTTNSSSNDLATNEPLATQLLATEAFVQMEEDASTDAYEAAAETELINDEVLQDLTQTQQLLHQDNSIAQAQNATAIEDNDATLASISSSSTTSTIANTNSNMDVSTTPKSNLPVVCTCGVFMTSQIKRGSYEPRGKPVILNELDRSYSCNSIGQKQCQTKCLETIVQHLPNSANILCATLERDCHKERAYLYIKNCKNQWYNTKLAAGREYCCKNGQPYMCPLV